MRNSFILFSLICLTLFTPKDSWQLGPADPECFELGTCNIFEEPLTAMLLPFNEAFGGFTLVILWGIIMGVLWLRVQNTMMIGIVGVALAAVFFNGFSTQTQIIGYGLLFVAIGIALYQLVSSRLHYPVN